MPQQLKPEVRERMESAAEVVFAELGFEGATMAAIANQAGVATGNLYRYFGGKDALFDRVVTDDFAASLLSLVKRRVDSLVATDLTALDDEALHDQAELLRFWVEHRTKVLILLDVARARGTRLEGFSARFVDALMRPTIAALRGKSCTGKLPRGSKLVLRSIFENTVRTIVTILEAHSDGARVRAAFTIFWRFQLAGLAGLERMVLEQGRAHSDAQEKKS